MLPLDETPRPHEDLTFDLTGLGADGPSAVRTLGDRPAGLEMRADQAERASWRQGREPPACWCASWSSAGPRRTSYGWARCWPACCCPGEAARHSTAATRTRSFRARYPGRGDGMGLSAPDLAGRDRALKPLHLTPTTFLPGVAAAHRSPLSSRNVTSHLDSTTRPPPLLDARGRLFNYLGDRTRGQHVQY